MYAIIQNKTNEWNWKGVPPLDWEDQARSPGERPFSLSLEGVGWALEDLEEVHFTQKEEAHVRHPGRGVCRKEGICRKW